ncbi:unhealthy ribosome biogenesis protein 2 homolog [Liolophura sinensis]|uniref:unhealthy ribosome biogenesis protein 2 homolog n=1 Tax=Liolophura sinensis TaxID=3198878 RepID=UPI0031594369
MGVGGGKMRLLSCHRVKNLWEKKSQKHRPSPYNRHLLFTLSIAKQINDKLLSCHRVKNLIVQRLKDRHTAISDKLKLVKLKLSDDEVEEVWRCLAQILQSPRLHSPAHAVVIKNSFCQAVCDVLLSSERVSSERAALTSVLNCCQSVVGSPALRHVFTSRYDNLAQLYSLWLTVAGYPRSSDSLDPSQTLDLVNKLTHHYRRAQNANSNQKQVLQSVSERLLIPVSVLLHKLSSSKDQALCLKLKEVLSQAFFHREHLELYRFYLVKADQGRSAPPKLLQHLLSQLRTGLQGKVNFPSIPPDRIQNALVQYLPDFYQSFIKESSLKSTGHHLLVWLTDVLIPQETSDSLDTQFLVCLKELLRVTQVTDVYNVAQDSVGGGHQLRFYRGVIDKLLNQSPCESLFDCLIILLQMNHAILEPKVKVVLRLCWSVDDHFDSGVRSRCADFLCELVSTYVQLRQLPRWLEKVLSLLHSVPDIAVGAVCQASLLQVFGKQVELLPPGMMLDMWAHFTQDLTDYYLPSLLSSSAEGHVTHLYTASKLFSVFLRNVRVAEQTITSQTLGKVKQLMAATEEILRKLMTLVATETMNWDLVYCALMLCHTWGEVSMLMEARETTSGEQWRENTDKDPHLSAASSPFDFSLVHPYLSSNLWCRLCQNIMKRGAAKCQHMVCKLQVQKLRALCLQRDGDLNTSLSVQSVTESLLTLTFSTTDHQSWDGQPFLITSETLPVAQWSLVANCLPLMCPRLSESLQKSLASFIVQTIMTDCIRPVDSSSGDRMSMCSVSRELLRSPFLHEQSSLVSAIITGIWAKIKADMTGRELRLKKKRKMSAEQKCLAQVFDAVSREDIDWCAVTVSTDSKWMGQLEGLSTFLPQLVSMATPPHLEAGEAVINCIEVLNALPVEYLSPGDGVRTLSGLFTLLVTCVCDTPRKAPPILLRPVSHLIRVIVDSQTKCPFLHLVGAGVLFSWCEQFADWLQSLNNCREEEKAEGWEVINTLTRAVVRDLQLFTHLHHYVTSVRDRLIKMKKSMTHKGQTFESCRTLLYLITRIVEEMSKVVRRRSSTKEKFQAVCCEYVQYLAEPCLKLIDLACQTSEDSVLASLCRCYTALVGLVRDGGTPLGSVLAQDTALQQVTLHTCDKLMNWSLGYISSGQTTALRPVLNFVNGVCNSSSELSLRITSEQRCALWDSLWKCLRIQVDQGETGMRDRMSSDSPELLQPWGIEAGDNINDKNSILSAVSSCLARLLSSCEPEEFSPLMKSVEQNCHVRHLQSEPWRPHCAALVWDHLLSCDLTEDHMTVFCQAVFNTLSQCQFILEELRWRSNPELITGVLVPVLQLEHRMLQFGEVLMSDQTAGVVLHGCQLNLLDRCPAQLYGRVFTCVYNVLNAFMVHHTDTLLRSIPSVVSACKLMMCSLIQRSDQDKIFQWEGTLSGSLITDLVHSAYELDRLFGLLSSHKAEMKKVSPYIVSDYVTEVQRVTVLPVVKKALVPAICKVLDICDNHGIALLHTVLNPGVTEVFKLLYEEYCKHYRYTGRV